MTRLSHKDYDLVLDVIREISAHTEIASLPQTMIRLLSKAVPCEVVAYNELHAVTQEITAVHNFHDPQFVQRLFPALMAHIHQHPVWQNRIQTGRTEVRKVTDFVSQNQFERTGVYNEFFKRVGIRRQMTLYLPMWSKFEIALTLQRSRRDFTERDRQVLQHLRLALAQTHHNATALAEAKDQVGNLTRVLENAEQGIIFVNSDGAVEQMTPRCAEWLREFFSFSSSTGLPERLLHWLRTAQTSAPFQISIPGKHLFIRKLQLDANTSGLLLSIEETATVEHFQRLGLTSREAQVLLQ